MLILQLNVQWNVSFLHTRKNLSVTGAARWDNQESCEAVWCQHWEILGAFQWRSTNIPFILQMRSWRGLYGIIWDQWLYQIHWHLKLFLHIDVKEIGELCYKLFFLKNQWVPLLANQISSDRLDKVQISTEAMTFGSNWSTTGIQSLLTVFNF